MKQVYITGMARTPFGAFSGALSSLSAPQLGSVALKAALERAQATPQEIDEVIMGQVLSAGVGQAPCRQASLGAGIPSHVPCTTVNKVCGSGMKAVMLAAQAIALGQARTVAAGGMESMSQAPYLLPGARNGYRLGHQKVVDSMILDGLWNPYDDQHMGNCAELCAWEKGYTRAQQDEYAIESFKRAQAADFSDELVPVNVTGPKGQSTLVEQDEGPQKVQFQKIPTLKPAFEKEGTVTAANASSINDGAVALILTDGSQSAPSLARIVAASTHAQAPEWFTTAPIPAVEKVVKQAGWSLNDVDLFEVNEAFAVVAIAARDALAIPPDRFNVNGGAIALGHPIGASGARILIALVNALRQRKLRRGVAAICIGGGEATAMAIEIC